MPLPPCALPITSLVYIIIPRQNRRKGMKVKAPLLFLFGRKLSRSLASLSQFLLWVGGRLFGGLQNRGLARTRSSPKEGLRSRKRHL